MALSLLLRKRWKNYFIHHKTPFSGNMQKGTFSCTLQKLLKMFSASGAILPFKQEMLQVTMSKVFRSSHPELFLRKGVLKICSKFTGEHPCRSVILMKLQSNLIEIALRHGCSPVNLLLIFWTPFPRNTSGWLLLSIKYRWSYGHWI